MNYPVLKSVITFFSHIFHSVPCNAPSVPFAPRKLFLSARSEDVHCQEDIILHLSLAEVVFSLCIHGIVAENHCDGAGGWRGSVLSWHPLPNNWMAYQVTPRSLIALFRPWLAETPTVTAYSEKKRKGEDFKNSPPARLCSRLGIDCKVQGRNAAASFCLALFSHEQKWFLPHFPTFICSVIDWTDWSRFSISADSVLLSDIWRWAVIQELSDPASVFDNDKPKAGCKCLFLYGFTTRQCSSIHHTWIT